MICFGLLGVRAGFLLDWNLKVFCHLVCLHIISLFSALQCLVVWSERGWLNKLNKLLTERSHFVWIEMRKFHF